MLNAMDADIKAQLDRIEAYARLNAKRVMTVEDACFLTGLSRGNLYVLCEQRCIPHYRQGRRLYFKREEVEGWMTANRRACNAELASKAEVYTRTHNINN